MGDFSVFGSTKPYQNIDDKRSKKITFENAQKVLDRVKPNYKSIDRIGNFDGYIITFDRFVGGIAYINVNGKEFPISLTIFIFL